MKEKKDNNKQTKISNNHDVNAIDKLLEIDVFCTIIIMLFGTIKILLHDVEGNIILFLKDKSSYFPHHQAINV